MAEVVLHGKRIARRLSRRQRVVVELPEFLIRAIGVRVDEANLNAHSASAEVTFNDVIEWLLVSEVTIRRMPQLEVTIPGFTAAMTAWLMEATYQAPDGDE